MSGPEHFLTRWSRKKRAAAEQAGEPVAPEAADAAAREQPSAAAEPAPAATAPKVDLASLPPLESIGAGSDIRAFLQAGVPSELTRAALRRAWTSDPIIRDFIGLAENSWDFTAPDGVPGFGPLKATDDIRRMVAEIIGDLGQASEPGADATAPKATETALESSNSVAREAAENDRRRQDIAAAEQDQSEEKTPLPAADDVVQRKEVDVAAQHRSDDAEDSPQPKRRPHGGALPE